MIRPRLLRSALDRKPALIVLLYHGVDHNPPSYLKDAGVVTHPDDFRAHVQWARQHYDVTSLSDGIELLRSGQLKRTTFAFTFDDGLISCCGQGLNILKQHDVPSTLFINGSSLTTGRLWQYEVAWMEKNGNQNLLKDIFGPCDGPTYARYLRRTASQKILAQRQQCSLLCNDLTMMPVLHIDYQALQSLQDNPLVEIGNHSLDHPRFSRISKQEQRRQIMDNHQMLCSLRNYKTIFAVPFGTSSDWDFHTIEAAASCRHEFVSAQGGINIVGHTGVDIRRVPCDGVKAGQLEEHLFRVGLGML